MEHNYIHKKNMKNKKYMADALNISSDDVIPSHADYIKNDFHFEDFILGARYNSNFSNMHPETEKIISYSDLYHSTPIDAMIKLIQYNNHIKNLRKNNKFIDHNDGLMYILREGQCIDIPNTKGMYCTFLDAKYDLQKRYPDLIIKIENDNTLDLFKIEYDNKLELLQKKITSLEQYQANILDKLSVFAEMIDNNKNEKPSISNENYEGL